MKLLDDDKKLLSELCRKHEVSFYKVLKLLKTVYEYEFKDRRTGIYDVLRDILKSNMVSSDEEAGK